ncbi:MAG TPA: hypothetical protein VI248_04050 [Kineosporiaceae bacterium]
MISGRSSLGFAGALGAPALLVAVLGGCSSTSPAAHATTTSTWSVGTPAGPMSGTGGGARASASAGSSSSPAAAGSTGLASGLPTGDAAQPGEAASRDGVPSSIAALPSAARVRQVPRGPGRVTWVTAADGVWLVSRPQGAPPAYAEVLHLDAAGRILRAYPFPGVAPQWLVLSPRAVYCGRHGESGAPDAMVCRIDRASGEVRVRVSADRAPDTVVTQRDVASLPGVWTVDNRTFTVDLGQSPVLGTELTFRSRGGELRLDPDTLAVLGS